MKNCDRIWGKFEENQDDGQYCWMVFSGLRVDVQNQKFGCSMFFSIWFFNVACWVLAIVCHMWSSLHMVVDWVVTYFGWLVLFDVVGVV